MNHFPLKQLVKFFMASLSILLGAYGLILNNLKGYSIFALSAILFYLYTIDMYKELKNNERN